MSSETVGNDDVGVALGPAARPALARGQLVEHREQQQSAGEVGTPTPFSSVADRRHVGDG